jgi:hypothetical protein
MGSHIALGLGSEVLVNTTTESALKLKLLSRCTERHIPTPYIYACNLGLSISEFGVLVFMMRKWFRVPRLTFASASAAPYAEVIHDGRD